MFELKEQHTIDDIENGRAGQLEFGVAIPEWQAPRQFRGECGLQYLTDARSQVTAKVTSEFSFLKKIQALYASTKLQQRGLDSPTNAWTFFKPQAWNIRLGPPRRYQLTPLGPSDRYSILMKSVDVPKKLKLENVF